MIRFASRPSSVVISSALAVVATACKPRSFNEGSVKDTPTTGRGAVVNGFLHDPNDGSCGGFPRLHVETMAKTCLGMVHTGTPPKFAPRAILPMPGASDEFLISDFAGWSETQGKLWYLKVDRSGPRWKSTVTQVMGGLSLPHQVVLGPDNWIFFSEDKAIHRVTPKDVQEAARTGNMLTFQTAASPSGQIRTVLTNLPPMMRGSKKNSMHPLKHFVFDKEWNLYLNVGAYTDHCDAIATSPGAKDGCTEVDMAPDRALTPPPAAGNGDVRLHGAVIRRYPYSGSVAKGWDAKAYTIAARGLRNSMGMLFTDSGDLLQAENGRDFKESNRPYEELNFIPKAELTSANPLHFGWPYCYDYDSAAEDWAVAGFSCAPGGANRYTPPYAFLPPHSAPLGLIRYRGTAIKDLNSDGNGSLIVPLHGYRPAGQRILAFKVDASGKPLKPATPGANFSETTASGIISTPFKTTPSAVPSMEVISGWFESPGVRPKGAPVAIAEAADGTIWMVDDKNGAVLRLAPFDGVPFSQANLPDYGAPYTAWIKGNATAQAKYKALVQNVLASPQCEGCHDTYKDVRDTVDDGFKELRYVLRMGTWVNLQQPAGKRTAVSTLYTKLQPGGSMPPIDRPAWPGGPSAALGTIAQFIDALPAPAALKAATTDAPITGTNPGAPGNAACGTIKVGSVVTSKQVAKLGGVEVMEMDVEATSPLIDPSCHGKWKAYWVPTSAFKAAVK